MAALLRNKSLSLRIVIKILHKQRIVWIFFSWSVAASIISHYQNVLQGNCLSYICYVWKHTCSKQAFCKAWYSMIRTSQPWWNYSITNFFIDKKWNSTFQQLSFDLLILTQIHAKSDFKGKKFLSINKRRNVKGINTTTNLHTYLQKCKTVSSQTTNFIFMCCQCAYSNVRLYLNLPFHIAHECIVYWIHLWFLNLSCN